MTGSRRKGYNCRDRKGNIWWKNVQEIQLLVWLGLNMQMEAKHLRFPW